MKVPQMLGLGGADPELALSPTVVSGGGGGNSGTSKKMEDSIITTNGTVSTGGGGGTTSATSSPGKETQGNNSNNNSSTNVVSKRAAAALLYALSSSVIMFVNKITLYNYVFPSPSMLAMFQSAFMLVSLQICRHFDIVDFPEPTISNLLQVLPLSILFASNAASGLASTKSLSIPMFTVLRRTSVVMTMMLETAWLGQVHSRKTIGSIACIIFGSFVAAMYDLDFDAWAYFIIFLNNVFTAFSGVLTKKMLSGASAEEKAVLSVWGLMYLNSLMALPLILCFLLFVSPESLLKVWHYDQWSDPGFLFCFSLSTMMGTVLQFSTFYCTRLNSALTTTLVGVMKNVFTAYVGVLLAGLGYHHSWHAFIGINLSTMGGVWYVYTTYMESKPQQQGKT